jgi:hypothetical protein
VGDSVSNRLDEPVVYGSPELLQEVVSFLAYESELLDEWRLQEWLELFTHDANYLVPATDRPDGDPDEDLFFVRDDRFLLSQRVAALADGTAWTENPHSTTHRMISNVRARVLDEDRVRSRRTCSCIGRAATGFTSIRPTSPLSSCAAVEPASRFVDASPCWPSSNCARTVASV